MTQRFSIVLLAVLAIGLADCKHSPAEKSADPAPVEDCLSYLDESDSLTMDTPFVTTGAVITYEDEPVPAASFRRFSMLYADAKAPRSPDAVVAAFGRYWMGRKLAEEAGVRVTRGEVEARYETIAARFPDETSFDQFLTEAGLTAEKLRAVVCRDARLQAMLQQREGVEVSSQQAREAFERGDFSGLAHDGRQFERLEPLIERALEAQKLRTSAREILDESRVEERVSPAEETEVTSSLTDDYTQPGSGSSLKMIFEGAGWTMRFSRMPGEHHQLHRLEHPRLMLMRGVSERVRQTSSAYPYAAYLVEDRVGLSAWRADRTEMKVRAEGSGEQIQLSSDNAALSAWLRPLGTLPLAYMDVMRRVDVRAPAVTPRGEALGVTVVYECAASTACLLASFPIDVLDAEEAETWAIYQYPPVRGERVYRRNCATCHGPEGEGLEQIHPPLIQTRWTSGELGARALIESVALGTEAESLSGQTEIGGQVYGSDLMPSFVDHLNPREVRAVVNYVASSWGNRGPTVSEEQVIDVFCDNGHEVVYRARIDSEQMSERLARARSAGDCGDEVRAELEALDEPIEEESLEERAEVLYGANCSACHGEHGAGDGPAGQVLHPRPTDFTDPSSWKHGRDVTSAYLAIAEGVDGTSMQPYGDSFDHAEVKALAQLVVGWLPHEARQNPAGEGAWAEYCRVETERRRLEWDRCSSSHPE